MLLTGLVTSAARQPLSGLIYVIRIPLVATCVKDFLAHSDCDSPEATIALSITRLSALVSLTDIPGTFDSSNGFLGRPAFLFIKYFM